MALVNPPHRPAGRWYRRLRRVMIVATVLLALWMVAVQSGCFSMRTPERQWREKLREQGQWADPYFTQTETPSGRRVHAAGIGADTALPLAVLVHGSPGSADAFLNFLADTLLTRRMRLVAIDRPGFGYTSGFGVAEGSLQVQAEAVRALADRLSPDRPVILLGHSLGGPVIAQFAMSYPERTAGLILVAASIDPALEPRLWWQAVVNAPPLCWLVPSSLYASNREIMQLRRELERMLPGWSGLRCPVTVLHAQNDRLVPVGNADFARRMLTNSPSVRVDLLPDGDHFILWNRHARMREALLDGLQWR